MEFREVKVSSCFRGDEYGVSSLVFDPQEELLWAATFGVSVNVFAWNARSPRLAKTENMFEECVTIDNKDTYPLYSTIYGVT